MKKFIVLSVCLLFLSYSYDAFAINPQPEPPRIYASGNIGIAFISDSDISEPGFPTIEVSFDSGFALAGAVGTSFDTFRIEGAIAYQLNDFDSAMGVPLQGDITSLTFLLNGYYDFINNSPLTPYITGGLGFSMMDVNNLGVAGDIDTFDSDDTVFAYQLGVGFGYSFNDNLTLDASYRYFASADPDFDGTTAEVASHNILLGFRYNF